jgi:hypothetical protein
VVGSRGERVKHCNQLPLPLDEVPGIFNGPADADVPDAPEQPVALIADIVRVRQARAVGHVEGRINAGVGYHPLRLRSADSAPTAVLTGPRHLGLSSHEQ